MKVVARLLIVAGNTLTAVGCAGLLLATTGLIAIEGLSIGLSSGLRVVGSVAVAGCLLSAAGYAYEEHQLSRKD